MSSGFLEERSGKRGVSYRIRYTVDGAQRSESFPAWKYGTKTKAKEAATKRLAEIRTDIGRGQFVVPATTTLRELVDTWLESRGDAISPSTRYQYGVGLHRLPPDIANRSAQSLTTMQLQRMFTRLAADGHGAPILRTLATVLTGSLNAGVRWGVLHHSPMRGVTVPKPADTRLKYWAPDQIKTFLVGTQDHQYAVLWRLALLTGMRGGELHALRWSDCSPGYERVTVARTLTRSATGGRIMGEVTKTGNSYRTIPLPPTCIEALKAHRAEQIERRLRSPRWDTTHGELIFESGAGCILAPETPARALAQEIARLGLPKIPPHGMRHSCATALLIQGVSPRTVADLLGDDVTTILKVYSHVTDDLRHGALAQLDEMLEGLG
jgi:integrase